MNRSVSPTRRHFSCSTQSKSASSSSKSTDLSSLPFLIQLSLLPDEKSSCRTMRLFFASTSRSSPNVSDQFGCHLMMYVLRYQRFRLLEFLLREVAVDLNFAAKDRHGNSILHYAVVYARDQTQIMEKLIDKFNQFKIDVDQRNTLGFTPLLLAIFCGRYDLALLLLTKSDASPFVRDEVQLKNIIDYLHIDLKHHQSPRGQRFPCLSPESTRVLVQLHQSLPSRRETSKNFFESFFPQAVADQSGFIRSLIVQTIGQDSSSPHFNPLIVYLNRRYPRIKTARRRENSTSLTPIQREDSKVNIHQILSLFDPDLRPKMLTPKPSPPKSLPNQLLVNRQPITFKRLGARITTIAAFSRANLEKRRC